MRKHPNSQLSKLVAINIFKKPHLGLEIAKKRKMKQDLAGPTRFRKNWMENAKLKYIFGNVSTNTLKNIGSLSLADRIITLECQLSALVYRAGFAPTIRAAQQLVSHGHIAVNSKIVTQKSYQVAVGDMISFADGDTETLASRLGNSISRNKLFLNCSPYLEVNLAINRAILVYRPHLSEIVLPVPMNRQSIK